MTSNAFWNLKAGVCSKQSKLNQVLSNQNGRCLSLFQMTTLKDGLKACCRREGCQAIIYLQWLWKVFSTLHIWEYLQTPSANFSLREFIVLNYTVHVKSDSSSCVKTEKRELQRKVHTQFIVSSLHTWPFAACTGHDCRVVCFGKLQK